MAPEKEPSSSSENSPEHRGLLYILLSAFVFLSGWSLSKLRTPIEQFTDPVNDDDSADNTTESHQSTPSPPIRVVIDSAPPTPSPDKKRENREVDQERRDKKRLVVETATAFLLLLYTIVTLCLWLATRHANEIATESVARVDRNFRADERAWMAFKFMEGNITFTLDKSFLVPTELVNTGKTPAKNVHGNIAVGVFKSGAPLDFTYTPGHPSYKVAAGTLFPNGKIVESFEAIKHGQVRAEPIIFTVPLKDELFSAKSFVVVHGRIEYKDIFGTDHWTTYCRYVLHPELISEECVRYNDTDDNK